MTEFRSANHSGNGYLVDPEPNAIGQRTKTLALTAMLVALWSLTHLYKGLGGDAELYAVQALARIHSNLGHDLFLRNASQDSYTLFSPFYAWWIGMLGLRSASLTLAIVFKVWFFAAAWALARDLSNSHTAFLGVAMLIITVGAYGAYDVFRYAEDWLTARSLAEALVITALVLYFRGLQVFGLLVACGAMIVHPLMALPGVLLLICLWSSLRMSAIGAAAAVLATFGVALDALRTPASAHFLLVMDADWLEVVRERSQFLFLQLWSATDWKQNARPFLSLTLSAMAIDDSRVRKLCAAAMLVGATGLAVALIASVIGPISILLQGQAWRWVWVTVFASVLLLAPTALRLWREEKCGRLCAILMISAWTISAIDGAACMACALILWVVRDHINARAAMVLRWVALAVTAVIVGWVIHTSWTIALSRPAESGDEPLPITLIRGFLGVQILSVMIIGSLASWIKASRSVLLSTITGGALLAVSALILPGTLRDSGRDGTPEQIREFWDWRHAIPPESNVLVVPAHNSATFAWFTLERPSYLTVDQSSGVVFSRATALEVRRRSQVLLPLMDPDWRLLSNIKKAGSSSNGALSSSPRAVTRDRLISLCHDSQLNFVIAKENIGFDPIRHTHPGNWQDWNLYDCRRVNSVIPSA